MSENTNKQGGGGLLEQLAENKLKPLINPLDEQQTSKYDAHGRFGLLKGRFETSYWDVTSRTFFWWITIFSKRYNVCIYEKGVELIETKTYFVHSIPYQKIKQFKTDHNYIQIVLTDGKKFVLGEDNIAEVVEVGNILAKAYNDYRKSI